MDESKSDDSEKKNIASSECNIEPNLLRQTQIINTDVLNDDFFLESDSSDSSDDLVQRKHEQKKRDAENMKSGRSINMLNLEQEKVDGVIHNEKKVGKEVEISKGKPYSNSRKGRKSIKLALGPSISRWQENARKRSKSQPMNHMNNENISLLEIHYDSATKAKSNLTSLTPKRLKMISTTPTAIRNDSSLYANVDYHDATSTNKNITSFKGDISQPMASSNGCVQLSSNSISESATIHCIAIYDSTTNSYRLEIPDLVVGNLEKNEKTSDDSNT